MDIKAKITQVVTRLMSDKDLLNKFNTNPTAVIEELVGMDLPDDLVNQLIDGVKAKITAEKIGGALNGLGKLFGK